MTINQHAFITEYLQHRSLFTAYCLAYNVQDESDYEHIMSSAHQLMDDPEVGGRIRSILSNMHSEVEQQIRKEQQTTLLTVQRKRELLAQIATGEMYAVQTYKGKDCTQCTQHIKPTINQMLKAIDLDNKLAGHYSVGNSQFTVDNSQSVKSEKATELQPERPETSGKTQQNTTKSQIPTPRDTTGTSRDIGENITTEKTPILLLAGENCKELSALCNSGEVTREKVEKPQQITTNTTGTSQPVEGNTTGTFRNVVKPTERFG